MTLDANLHELWFLDEEGETVWGLKHAEYGFLVRFPDAGSQSVCSHCGANIYANDVFKKNKRPNRLRPLRIN